MLRAPRKGTQGRAETNGAYWLVGWPSYPRDAIRSFFEASVQQPALRMPVF
jgi:hypothetical protein